MGTDFRLIVWLDAALYTIDSEDQTLSAFKITTVGSSTGLILNKEAMAHRKIKKSDTIFLTEAPDGAYRLTPHDPDFERQMKLAEEIMHHDRNILKVLAK